MAPPVRGRATPPAVAPVNFGDLEADYSSGGGLPEGDYILEFIVQMYQAQNAAGQTFGKPRLGVMVHATPTDAEGTVIDEAKTKFYAMGGKAHLSFAPNPVTGKGLVAVPGGAGVSPTNKSNWALLLKSLYDSGMPKGVFTNDVTVLDGLWAHMHEVPEPEERKSYGKKGAKTGEAALEEEDEEFRGGNGKVTIVSEIKGGVAWWTEGSAPAPAAPAVAPRPAVKSTAIVAPPKAGPKGVVKPQAAAPDVDLAEVATNAIAAVLETKAAGLPKLQLKTSTFGTVKAEHGDEMAQAVIDTYFGSDADLNSILNTLDYGVTGVQVKPIAP